MLLAGFAFLADILFLVQSKMVGKNNIPDICVGMDLDRMVWCVNLI